MKILAFDTSNNNVSVAVSNGQKILTYIEDLRPSMQAERLLPMIEEALNSAGLLYSDIDYLAVVNGPGSFTGIRVGLAAAKGILFGAKIKGTAVTNFEMLYFRARFQVKQYDKIMILLNAYRGQLYVQSFTKNSETTTPLLLDYDAAVELLQTDEALVVASGSGLEFIYDKIKMLPNKIILPRFSRVKALHVCRYINSVMNIRALKPIEPLYIRPIDVK